MRLIIGLGNPGGEYEKTRHNAGFLAIDRLAERLKIHGGKSKFHSLVLDATLADEKCLLMKPATFMNHSGLAVAEAATFYKVAPKDILILVDDLALPCGKIRLRGEGSPGGHNGLISVEQSLGTDAYRRLRIGIDSRGRAPQTDYVLGRFTEDQWRKLQPALDTACDCIESWIKHGLAKTMSIHNADTPE